MDASTLMQIDALGLGRMDFRPKRKTETEELEISRKRVHALTCRNNELARSRDSVKAKWRKRYEKCKLERRHFEVVARMAERKFESAKKVGECREELRMEKTRANSLTRKVEVLTRRNVELKAKWRERYEVCNRERRRFKSVAKKAERKLAMVRAELDAVKSRLKSAKGSN